MMDIINLIGYEIITIAIIIWIISLWMKRSTKYTQNTLKRRLDYLQGCISEASTSVSYYRIAFADFKKEIKDIIKSYDNIDDELEVKNDQ